MWTEENTAQHSEREDHVEQVSIESITQRAQRCGVCGERPEAVLDLPTDQARQVGPLPGQEP